MAEYWNGRLLYVRFFGGVKVKTPDGRIGTVIGNYYSTGEACVDFSKRPPLRGNSGKGKPGQRIWIDQELLVPVDGTVPHSPPQA